jgi:hypothetical protein
MITEALFLQNKSNSNTKHAGMMELPTLQKRFNQHLMVAEALSYGTPQVWGL